MKPQPTAARLALRWGETVVNVKGALALWRLPGYLADWRRYARGSKLPVRFRDTHPCLGDAIRHTPFDAHYVYQAAWLARRLAETSVKRHIDVGSSVETIAVLSAFVDTVSIDYRPLEVELPGLRPKKGDVTALDLPTASAESLSCLHVIEHIGLGRYGDPIDPEGSSKAVAELARVLAPGGALFVSVPVGRERVCFNAHRVFAPTTVLQMFSGLDLKACAYVDDDGRFHEDAAPEEAASCSYGCGMFHFVRPGTAR